MPQGSDEHKHIITVLQDFSGSNYGGFYRFLSKQTQELLPETDFYRTQKKVLPASETYQVC